jgi:hypothetical protein
MLRLVDELSRRGAIMINTIDGQLASDRQRERLGAAREYRQARLAQRPRRIRRARPNPA